MVDTGTTRAVLRFGSVASGACGMLMSGALLAQQAPETAFLEELPVVLSASRLPQSLADTPGAVTVIDRDLIRATGYRDIPRLLRLVPGFTVPQSRGHALHASYHGLAAEFPNRMQVLIDGRSVYTPYLIGGVDWASLPITIDEIERIEVLRGSNSASYGSNAFLGVVNIVTRHSAQDQGSAAWGGAGNTQIRDLGFKHGGQSGDFGYRVSVQFMHDRGFDNVFDTRTGAVVTFRGDYRLRANEELTLLAGAHEGKRGFGFAGTSGNTNGERDESASTAFANLRWRRQLGIGSEISVGYYRNVERAYEAWTAQALPFFPNIAVDFDRSSVRDNADFQHIFAAAPGLRVVWGAEIRRDSLESKRLFATTGGESQRLARLYGNGEWRALDALVVNAGAMVEKYSGRETNLAPRLFLNWHVNGAHTLRAGASRAYRAPSFFEERGDTRFSSNGLLLLQTFTPPGSLRPERIDAAELGYLGRIAAWNGTVDVRLYRERIRDFIADRGVLSPLAPPPLLSASTAKFFNFAGEIVSRGIEGHVRVRPLAHTELMLGYARMHIGGAPSLLDQSVPRNQGSLTWLQRYAGNWDSTLTMHRSGAYKWGGGALPTPAYTAYDLRISYRTAISGRHSEFALVLLNQGAAHEELTWSDASGRTIVARQAFFTARFDF